MLVAAITVTPFKFARVKVRSFDVMTYSLHKYLLESGNCGALLPPPPPHYVKQYNTSDSYAMDVNNSAGT